MGMLAISLSYAQKVSWQKNIDSGTQDFLSGLAVTIDGQYLVSGSSIQTLRQAQDDSSGSTAVNQQSTHNQNGNVPNKLVNKNSIEFQYYFYRNKIGK